MNCSYIQSVQTGTSQIPQIDDTCKKNDHNKNELNRLLKDSSPKLRRSSSYLSRGDLKENSDSSTKSSSESQISSQESIQSSQSSSSSRSQSRSSSSSSSSRSRSFSSSDSSSQSSVSREREYNGDQREIRRRNRQKENENRKRKSHYEKRGFDEKKSKCLYVANLSEKVTESSLRKSFEKYGKIEYINICYKPYSQQQVGIKIPAGYAFIKYHSLSEAERALNHLDRQNIKGKKISIEFSKRENPRKSKAGPYHCFEKKEKESIDQAKKAYIKNKSQSENASPSLQSKSSFEVTQDKKSPSSQQERKSAQQQQLTREEVQRNNRFSFQNNNENYRDKRRYQDDNRIQVEFNQEQQFGQPIKNLSISTNVSSQQNRCSRSRSRSNKRDSKYT